MPRSSSPTRIALGLCFCLLPLALAWADEKPANAPAPETAPPVEAARPTVEERSQAEASGLTQTLPERQQQTLQAGTESFLALWLPANAPRAEGVVIIVPGNGESADWPQAVGPLRRKLPDAGWQTLSLSLPDPMDSLAQTRPVEAGASTNKAKDKDKDKDEESAKADAPSPSGDATSASETPPAQDPAIEQRKAYADRVMARIQAGVDFALQNKPKSIILLGHGTGAYWAARYLAEREPADIRNLLLVAAQMPNEFRPPLEDMVPRLQLATGDFYYKDRDGDRQTAKLRLQASKRETGKTYVQVGMNAVPGDPVSEQDQLYRRVRGWLSMHIKQADSP
ncbi:alpha/beta hydrolase family protein [Pseudomonas knackmussii]|uniref:alpha/beta hydrolase family protein n=1 Tax=Pseudomonas knackmussii TaxID=65741 RepID=UPI001363081B|nr:alpha/beta hydrolase family protein [Pseudomonas knackmussii]